MSWSVNANGKIADVVAELDRQFACPLAEGSAGLSDESEKCTVLHVQALMQQCLGTFDAEKTVVVSANGHMGFADWDTKTGAYQQVSVSIQPSS